MKIKGKNVIKKMYVYKYGHNYFIKALYSKI